jgi:hypothetical protein
MKVKQNEKMRFMRFMKGNAKFTRTTKETKVGQNLETVKATRSDMPTECKETDTPLPTKLLKKITNHRD